MTTAGVLSAAFATPFVLAGFVILVWWLRRWAADDEADRSNFSDGTDLVVPPNLYDSPRD